MPRGQRVSLRGVGTAAPHPSPAKVGVRRVGDVAVICVSGDLDIVGAPIVAAALRRVDGTCGRVVLDLERLEFIDSSGISMTVRAVRRAQQDGRDFVVASAAPAIVRVFHLADVAEEIRFAPNASAAL
jgi:anti-sigma B factor antagonist